MEAIIISLKKLFEIKNLTVTGEPEEASGQKILNKVNLKIESGEIHCLLGKNGSGKTTLAYWAMGLCRGRKKSGRFFFQKREITALAADKRAKLGITMAFQEPARFEGLTVAGFLRAGQKNITEAEMKKFLSLAGLGKDFLQRKIDEKLSGGERKRIELASVLSMRPKLLILDEPDASLDIIVYNELYDLILSFRESLGCGILLITHREEAGLIADKATLLENGRIISSGPFRQVMRNYCQREGRKDRCRLGQRRKSLVLDNAEKLGQ